MDGIFYERNRTPEAAAIRHCHGDIQRKHDHEIENEKDAYPDDCVNRIRTELRDLFHIRIQTAELLSKESSLVPVGR